MTSAVARKWADDLVFDGYSDWRLPTMIDTGLPGCDRNFKGGTDCGYNVQSKSGNTVCSELAHLFYVTLGNLSVCDPVTSTQFTCALQAGGGLRNSGPFVNIGDNGLYWTGLPYVNSTNTWSFALGTGEQDRFNENATVYAVAVRVGDVAPVLPEPATLALTLMALGATVAATKRRSC
jgi:hypothetical protein